MNSDMSSLKERKEQFVSDLIGGPVSEINLVTGISLFSFLLYQLTRKQLKDVPFIIDYSINALTILLSITLYSGQIKTLYLIIGIPGLLLLILSSKQTMKNTNKKKPKLSNNQSILPRKTFLTVYRASMIIITNFSILAVDFPIFPRRFAKVETWGTSLMDLGVGSFVFSMGLVNARSLIKKSYTRNYSFSVKSYLRLLWSNSLKALPILVLGIIRLVSVKGLEYQEHVTEYGLHWNFFFTLGFLPIIIAILDPILQFFPRFLVAFGISTIYELVLNKTDLLKYVLAGDNRMNSLVTMNKEGLCSFIGYLSIFIFGQSFGSFVLTGVETPYNLILMPRSKNIRDLQNKKKSKKSFFTVSSIQGLFISTIFYQTFFWYVNQSPFFYPVSRRLANFTYVLWVVSFNAFCLMIYDIADEFIGARLLGITDEVSSPILEAINNNGLFCFLLANLGTGLVNMTINTLDVNDSVAFVILAVYGLILTGIVHILDKKKIYIKI